MKTPMLRLPLVLLCFVLAVGCPWQRPEPPNGDEGEGEVTTEGEAPEEGEQPEEGETPEEGEGLFEGEPGEGEPEDITFTSADTSNFYRNDLETEEPVMVEDEETDGEDRELVEPDVIRRAGDLLFILNQYRGLTITDLAQETVLSQTITHGHPRDLYLVDDRAYVLVSFARDVTYEDDLLHVTYGSKIYVFNIADPLDVVEEAVFRFEGDLVDSRMVGDIIYAVCSDHTYYPVADEDGDTVVMEEANKSYGATWAISVNIADPENVAIADRQHFPGYGNLIQATEYAIFSVSGNWDAGWEEYVSTIQYIDITDAHGRIEMRGAAHAPGYMADRFKMDAWDGALRVVTNTWRPQRETYVTTFDITDPDRMAQLGQTRLESASGENVFATRFDGPMAYIVTYLMVDPLFVVDLSDPANPEVKGELKIPGWSTHIEPRGDRLIALGVDDEDGRRVMVSLFDVSDPYNPTRIAYESFGENWSWSSAYSDVKAFTVLDDMLLVPFSGWYSGSGGYNRLQFVSWTRDSLETRGYVDLQGRLLRSFRSDGLYYAVTQEQLAVIDGSNPERPEVVNSVVLAENIVDVALLSEDWLVEVISRHDHGDTLLRAVHPELDVVGGDVAVPVPHVSNVFVWHDAVVVSATVYEYEPEYKAYYLVLLVDFADPTAPKIIDRWQVAMTPWWGGWWWYRGPILDEPMLEIGKGMPIYGWWGHDAGNAWLAGDYLVLRGTRDTYDIVYGNERAWQGLALVDLAGADEIAYVGLGYEHVAKVDSADGLVHISTKRSVGRDDQQRNICAYFLQLLNPSTLEMSRTVNVPGVFSHRLPGTQRLIFEDTQYVQDWQTITILRSTELVGATVRLVDSLRLPMGYWTLMADGANLFYSGYNRNYEIRDDEISDTAAASDDRARQSAYVVGTCSVSRSGTFMSMEMLPVSTSWATLLGVKDNHAYVSVAGAAIAQYDMYQTPPVLEALMPIMGYPRHIRFGADAAYVPLGYSGWAVMPH